MPDCVDHEGALRILEVPFIYSQDGLLTSSEFIKKAKELGHRISHNDLRQLHNRRHLLPMYRVSDTPVEGRRIHVEGTLGKNALGWTREAALDGRLRDPAEEGYSAGWPYSKPEGVDGYRWWNGFIYSFWQLIGLGALIQSHRISAEFQDLDDSLRRGAVERRRLSILLAVLSTPYLPGIVGRLRLPMGINEEDVWRYRADCDHEALVLAAGFPIEKLSVTADALLAQAHSSDPMVRWLPVLRHANMKGIEKLKGESLESMWKRIAAEILLRAHEELDRLGRLDPLPELSATGWWSPQHDRLTPRYTGATTLDRALADMGISPHPGAILLVEGKTELRHIPRLLDELGVTQPRGIRVQNATSSKINAHLIARYGVTPRIGPRIDGRWLLEGNPTALIIAMDPENSFATPQKCAEVRRKLQEAVREEVEYLDATISQDELNFLVTVRVWGEDKYEIANFTDDELVFGITELARLQGNLRVQHSGWEADLRVALQGCRIAHDDIKIALGAMRVKEDKSKLADILWPALRKKCAKELAIGQVVTPVLRILLEARDISDRARGIFALAGEGELAGTPAE